MFSAAFWKGALERMLRMGAGTAIGIMTADGFNLLRVDLPEGIMPVAAAMLVSLCMSLVAVNVGPKGSASLVPDRPSDPENRS